MRFWAEQFNVNTPSTDGLGQQILDWVMAHPRVVACVIVAIGVTWAVKAIGEAVAGISAKLTIPLGIVVSLALLLGGAAMLK